MTTVIKVEQLSKSYHLGQIGTGTLSNDLKVWWAKRRGIPNPLEKIGMPNYSDQNGGMIWALKDVSFKVNQGEALGVIGRNGSGKSTLLKILSRVTAPTKGQVKIKGKIASLLEVGTGFHPDLTGRENIYLNGAILGMRKEEIRSRFDEIVEFAEVEKFLDTPIKRYSSGMYVRLAFAVAAHLEPDILLVDEVLAVGDVEFQKKCLGKMEDVAKGGRGVLFVSHNMGSILQLCEKAILLEKGTLKLYGNAREVTKDYLQPKNNTEQIETSSFIGNLSHTLRFLRVEINGKGTQDGLIFNPSTELQIRLFGETDRDIPAFRVTFSIFKDGNRLFTLHDVKQADLLPKGKFISTYQLPGNFLRPGEYSIALGGHRDGMHDWLWGTDLMTFTILEEWSDVYESHNLGLVNIPTSGERIICDPEKESG